MQRGWQRQTRLQRRAPRRRRELPRGLRMRVRHLRRQSSGMRPTREPMRVDSPIAIAPAQESKASKSVNRGRSFTRSSHDPRLAWPRSWPLRERALGGIIRRLVTRARMRRGRSLMANPNKGLFVWHEHLTKDTKAAIAFYTEVV